MSDCIFCKIIKGELPAEKVFEDDKVLAFLDIHPVTKGHTLLVPKEHYPDLISTPKEVVAEVVSYVPQIAGGLIKGLGATGLNLGSNNGRAAGQIIFHLHFHLIPRYTDDGLRMWGSRDYQAGEIEEIAEKIRNSFH